MKFIWFIKAILVLSISMQICTAKATSPLYVPPTLGERVKEAELIVVARVGRLKYMKHQKYPDPQEAWEVSDIPAAGFRPYVNLVEVKVLRAKPPTNDVQRANEKPDLPLWVQPGGCFPSTDETSSYPPTGEMRIFFLSRKLLRSASSLHLSNCRFPSVAYGELPSVQSEIKKSLLRIQ
ncbi:hypothetical protein [Acidovorax sp. HMWF029]|uniref:hypothetical protein n=1 Tax=Acidovorax sp. HMWF029 TaxID=2056863 RepID=UPI0011B255C6|nr:hypothetical protein [Acidovorax sp. HMWF029]